MRRQPGQVTLASRVGQPESRYVSASIYNGVGACANAPASHKSGRNLTVTPPSDWSDRKLSSASKQPVDVVSLIESEDATEPQLLHGGGYRR